MASGGLIRIGFLYFPEDHHPAKEQHHNGQDSDPRITGRHGDPTHEEGPKDCRCLAHDVVEAKKFGTFLCWNHLAEHRPAERLYAALDQANDSGQDIHLDLGVHKESEDRHANAIGSSVGRTRLIAMRPAAKSRVPVTA